MPSYPFPVARSSVLTKPGDQGGHPRGSSMCPPHCPPPFCTLPVHTPHVAQAGKMENKVYLHSQRQGHSTPGGTVSSCESPAPCPEKRCQGDQTVLAYGSLPWSKGIRGRGPSRPAGIPKRLPSWGGGAAWERKRQALVPYEQKVGGWGGSDGGTSHKGLQMSG